MDLGAAQVGEFLDRILSSEPLCRILLSTERTGKRVPEMMGGPRNHSSFVRYRGER